MKHFYILFENHTDGMEMYRALKAANFKVQISPTPRELSTCCGMSLLIEETDIKSIKEMADKKALSYIGIEGIENSFDPTRHRYG